MNVVNRSQATTIFSFHSLRTAGKNTRTHGRTSRMSLDAAALHAKVLLQLHRAFADRPKMAAFIFGTSMNAGAGAGDGFSAMPSESVCVRQANEPILGWRRREQK